MNKKFLVRFLSAVLSVLMLVGMLPAMAVFAEEKTPEQIAEMDVSARKKYYLDQTMYQSLTDRLEDMELVLTHGDYQLYFDKVLGTVGYYNTKTDEWLFSDPWDYAVEPNYTEEVRSQIIVKYLDGETEKTMNSFADAACRMQIELVPLKNGIRIEYAIGERGARKLLPMLIEKEAFEKNILSVIRDRAGENSKPFSKINTYFNDVPYLSMLEELEKAKTTKGENSAEYKKTMEKIEAYQERYPILKEKDIDLYVNTAVSEKEMRELEGYIKAYTDYTLDDLTEDHDFVQHKEEVASPALFEMALEYKLDDNGLVVSLPANGIRFDESSFRLLEIKVLPYMGAGHMGNGGYSFVPDGSGTLYELTSEDVMDMATRVYGNDFAISEGIVKSTDEIFRVPVFGQVEEIYQPTSEELEQGDAYVGERKGTTTKRGFLAIIEEGSAMGSIRADHPSGGASAFASVYSSYILRPSDTVDKKWTAYASRKYTGAYQIRYVMLTDDAKAEEAELSKYYECSWMGMACAYRDYLERTNDDFNRLTAAEVTDANGNASIPLYIETFGSIETVKKIMSMPITTSVALTSFEDITKMYDYLAEQGITNINFKMTGYANGGMYSDVPYDLEWEDCVAEEIEFEELAAYAQAKGFEIYPDFDFVYTSNDDGGSEFDMQDNVSRSIDKRYTTKRVYSATQQAMVSYFQMVLAPNTYSDFYLNLSENYMEYKNDATGISLSTFGNALNSNFDEDETVLREEAKDYVVEALAHFRNSGFNIMVDGGNAYTWNYADHILNISLDSSRRISELRAVPFVGVVLHGYVQYAGTPMNTEGNLNYAILKAIENGASIYFVLSANNTELLKEDILLSQNYAVRYDIWQEKMVELYLELNNALGDVQTMLITRHEVLNKPENASQRIPDTKEMLEDIQQEINDRMEAIEQQILKDQDAAVVAIRKHAENIEKAASLISVCNDFMNGNYLSYLKKLRFATANISSITANKLLNYWNQARFFIQQSGYEPPYDVVEELTKEFTGAVVTNWVNLSNEKQKAEETVVSAKESYDALVAERGSDHRLTKDAKVQLQQALSIYLTLLRNYTGKSALDFVAGGADAYVNGSDSAITALYAQLNDSVVNSNVVADADLQTFFFGNDAAIEEKYASIGAENLYNAFIRLLEIDGLYNAENAEASIINVKKIEEELWAAKLAASAEGSNTEIADGAKTDANDKYAINKDIVVVTYGEIGADYKSFILNYNDYTVQTVYNGVIYTIDAYDYVIVEHQAQ